MSKMILYKSLSLFLVVAILVSLLPVVLFVSPVEAQISIGELDKEPLGEPEEVVSLRNEYSTTYWLGEDRYRLVTSIAPMHYKTDYTDDAEPWKPIDTTIRYGAVTTAPYTMSIDGLEVTFTDRRGGTATISLSAIGVVPLDTKVAPRWEYDGNKAIWRDASADLDVVIECRPDGIAYQRVLKSDKAETNAEYALDITGDVKVVAAARDADGDTVEVLASYTEVNSKLVEVVSLPLDTKYPVTVDPSIEIQPSTQDTYMRQNVPAGTDNGTSFRVRGDYTSAAYRALVWFDISAIPATFTTIDDGLMELYRYSYSTSNSRTYWAYRCTRTDWVEGEASWDNYKLGTPWTAPGGDYTVTDGVSSVMGSAPTWEDWDVTDIVDWAYTNTANVSILIKDVDEGGGSAKTALFYSSEYVTDTTKCPKLTVEYTTLTLPTVSADPATAVEAFAATLNGDVDDDGAQTIDYLGFVWDTTSRGDPGNVTPAGTAYANTWTSGAGDYGENLFEHDITSLLANTTYYFRSAGHNAHGWDYSAESSFTTVYYANVTTQAATHLTFSTARLHGLLNDDGGENCYMRFQYYGAGAGGSWATANTTAWVSGFSSGQTHLADLVSLNFNELYTFRVQGNNTAGVGNGTALTFTTINAVGDPSALTGVVAADAPTLTLSWLKGLGSLETVIRYQTGSYPIDYTDGSDGGTPTMSSASISGLDEGVTYYIRIWARSGTTYSVGYDQILLTTNAVPDESEGPGAPSTPALWFISTDYTRFVSMPLYDEINAFADSTDVPKDTMWFLLAILFCIACGGFVLAVSKNGQSALIVFTVALLACVVLRLLPLWLLAFVAIAFLGLAKMMSDQRRGLA